MGCEGNDIDYAAAAELERRNARGQNIVGGQYDAFEPGIHPLIMSDADMNLAPFQQGHLVHAEGFGQFDTYAREAFGVLRQEPGQDALDRLRGCGHLEHAGVFTFEEFYALAKRCQLAQHSSAVSEQLLTSGCQEKTATNAVEKLESALVFEIADLPRQSGLTDA